MEKQVFEKLRYKMNSFKMYLSRKYKNVPIKKVGLAQNKKKLLFMNP